MDVLVAAVDEVEVARFSPRAALAREPWALGVVSLQVDFDGRRMGGQLRATVSGRAAPVTAGLGPGALLSVYTEREGETRTPPAVELPHAGGGVLGGCALFIDGKPAGVALLDARNVRDRPPPRALCQVYCRWLRTGELELGCELGDFASLPPGASGPKLVSRFVEPRSMVTFGIVTPR